MSPPTPFDPNRLQPGDVAAGDIHDANGKRVVSGGRILCESVIRALQRKSGLTIAPAGPPDPADAPLHDPDQVAATEPGPESDERHPWRASLNVVIQHPGTDDIYRLHVVTEEISRAGFVFLTDCEIPAGAILRTRFTALPARPEVLAVVTACQRQPDSGFRIGARFSRRIAA